MLAGVLAARPRVAWGSRGSGCVAPGPVANHDSDPRTAGDTSEEGGIAEQVRPGQSSRSEHWAIRRVADLRPCSRRDASGANPELVGRQSSWAPPIHATRRLSWAWIAMRRQPPTRERYHVLRVGGRSARRIGSTASGRPWSNAGVRAPHGHRWVGTPHAMVRLSSPKRTRLVDGNFDRLVGYADLALAAAIHSSRRTTRRGHWCWLESSVAHQALGRLEAKLSVASRRSHSHARIGRFRPLWPSLGLPNRGPR
jgi:hypothetical protein